MSAASEFLLRRRGGRTWHFTDVLAWVWLALGLFLMFGPVLWMTLSSFKTQAALVEYPPTILPLETKTAAVAGYDKPLPLLWPNLVVVIILALIRGVQTFDEVYVLTGGGPGSSTQFLTQFIYQTGFANSIRNLGLASAASILMGLVLVVLTAIQLTASNWRERREAR